MRLVLLLRCNDRVWRHIDSKVCDLGRFDNVSGSPLRAVTVESAREDYGVNVP